MPSAAGDVLRSRGTGCWVEAGATECRAIRECKAIVSPWFAGSQGEPAVTRHCSEVVSSQTMALLGVDVSDGLQGE